MPVDPTTAAAVLMILAVLGALVAYIIRVSTAETAAANRAAARVSAPESGASDIETTLDASNGDERKTA
jgi:hypothetical protein